MLQQLLKEKAKALKQKTQELGPAEVKAQVQVHLKFLDRLPNWGFIVAVGLWTVAFKTALVPLAATFYIAALLWPREKSLGTDHVQGLPDGV